MTPKGHRHTDSPIQVHRYDEHTYILRQSKATSFEAPFLYLFFGNDRALCSTPARIRRVLPTTVVPATVEAVTAFFGFADWPTEVVTFDLGGRVLELTGIPGHDERSIAVYDRWTGFLITGDSAGPFRLYVRDMLAFVDSLTRLVEFASTRPVTHILGCHIEMSRRPRHDYHSGCLYQPHEAPLPEETALLRVLYVVTDPQPARTPVAGLVSRAAHALRRSRPR